MHLYTIFSAISECPDILVTDQGRNFESNLLKEEGQLLGIVFALPSPMDGLVERFNRTLLNILPGGEHEWTFISR